MLLDQDPRQIAAGIEGYLYEYQLYYGVAPEAGANGQPPKSSWTLATSNHEITSRQQGLLTGEFPALIRKFHLLSAHVITKALEDNPARRYQTTRKALVSGVPPETIDLWREALVLGIRTPFSTRPDMVIDDCGQMRVIEYNVDGGADKGNTEGVNYYAREFLGEKTAGEGLARLFVEGVRSRFPDRDKLGVTTVLPTSYRQEYDLQNIYFASQARQAGQPLGIDWTVSRINEMTGQRQLDIIDKEYKLPGFLEEGDLSLELQLTQSALRAGNLLGTPLPLADKLLFTTLFNPGLRADLTALVGDKGLDQLQQLHAETHLVDPDSDSVTFGSEQFSWAKIRNKETEFGMVLKRAGDNQGTTGSKGVIISTDLPGDPDYWRRAVDATLEAPYRGEGYWVIQRLYPSAKFPVSFLRDSAKQEKMTEAGIRFAPYYVDIDGSLQLGSILVTAGVDREIQRKFPDNIHGRRDNPYMAVTVK